jgi:hypothetical protein
VRGVLGRRFRVQAATYRVRGRGRAGSIDVDSRPAEPRRWDHPELGP